MMLEESILRALNAGLTAQQIIALGKRGSYP